MAVFTLSAVCSLFSDIAVEKQYPLKIDDVNIRPSIFCLEAGSRVHRK